MIDCSDLIGKKYKPHGRGKDAYDCYGLAIEVEKRLGNDIPEFDYKYSGMKVFEERFETVKDHLIKIDVPIEGALLMFNVSFDYKNHIGVYLGDGQFIHCNKYGVHLDNLEFYRENLKGIYIWQK